MGFIFTQTNANIVVDTESPVLLLQVLLTSPEHAMTSQMLLFSLTYV